MEKSYGGSFIDKANRIILLIIKRDIRIFILPLGIRAELSENKSAQFLGTFHTPAEPTLSPKKGKGGVDLLAPEVPLKEILTLHENICTL